MWHTRLSRIVAMWLSVTGLAVAVPAHQAPCQSSPEQKVDAVGPKQVTAQLHIPSAKTSILPPNWNLPNPQPDPIGVKRPMPYFTPDPGRYYSMPDANPDPGRHYAMPQIGRENGESVQAPDPGRPRQFILSIPNDLKKRIGLTPRESPPTFAPKSDDKAEPDPNKDQDPDRSGDHKRE
jgi:hypothetical protein